MPRVTFLIPMADDFIIRTLPPTLTIFRLMTVSLFSPILWTIFNLSRKGSGSGQRGLGLVFVLECLSRPGWCHFAESAVVGWQGHPQSGIPSMSLFRGRTAEGLGLHPQPWHDSPRHVVGGGLQDWLTRRVCKSLAGKLFHAHWHKKKFHCFHSCVSLRKALCTTIRRNWAARRESLYSPYPGLETSPIVMGSIVRRIENI